MKKLTTIGFIALSLLAGCGGKNDQAATPAPAPTTPVPTNPTPTPTVPGTNCNIINGSTPVTNGQVTANLFRSGGPGYQNNYYGTSTLTLSISFMNQPQYGAQINNVVGSGSITLNDIAYSYGNSNSNYSACISSASNGSTIPGVFEMYTGNIYSLVLRGQMQVPAISPYQYPNQYPSQYPNQYPGQFPNQYPGQQYPQYPQNNSYTTEWVEVVVGTNYCPARLVGNRLQGCVDVRIGSQNIQYQAQ